MDLGIAAIPTVVVICYLIAQVTKALGFDSKWCPVIVMASGGVLGIVDGFFTGGGILGADPLMCVAVGIVSGATATTVHQIGKQLGGGTT